MAYKTPDLSPGQDECREEAGNSQTAVQTTPQKPPSDSESLQKFMVWKLIKIDLEATSEVFEKFWCTHKFDHT